MKVLNQQEILDWIRPVQDPEMFLSLVDLGLVYKGEMNDQGHVKIELTLTSPGCPMGDQIVSEVSKKMKEYEGVTEVKVDVVWEPKWDPKEMASEECKESLGIW
jgi:metal-sulfur cluster biosynthetic enzyme